MIFRFDLFRQKPKKGSRKNKKDKASKEATAGKQNFS